MTHLDLENVQAEHKWEDGKKQQKLLNVLKLNPDYHLLLINYI